MVTDAIKALALCLEIEIETRASEEWGDCRILRCDTQKTFGLTHLTQSGASLVVSRRILKCKHCLAEDSTILAAKRRVIWVTVSYSLPELCQVEIVNAPTLRKIFRKKVCSTFALFYGIVSECI